MINLDGVVASRWQDVPAEEIFPGIRKRRLWQGSGGARALILEIDAGAKCPTLDVRSPGPEEV